MKSRSVSRSLNPVKHKRRFCRVEGCTRIVKSQGTCQRHGAKAKECKIVGCVKQAQGGFRGMCKCHARKVECARLAGEPCPFQEKANAALGIPMLSAEGGAPDHTGSADFGHDRILPPRRRRVCKQDDCNRIVKSQGLCQRHGALPTKCIVPGCPKQAQGNYRRMCKAHYRKLGQGALHGYIPVTVAPCQPVGSSSFAAELSSIPPGPHRVPSSVDDTSRETKEGDVPIHTTTITTREKPDDAPSNNALWEDPLFCGSASQNEELASDLDLLFEPVRWSSTAPCSLECGKRSRRRTVASNSDDFDQELLTALNDVLGDCTRDSYTEL